MEYIALDFETANRYMDSACSLGLSRMDEEGKVLSSWYSLIRPPMLYFDPGCTRVHQLDENEIKAARDFSALWPEIRDFIAGSVLVAHNATFDMSVLKTTAEYYGIQLPNYEYYCTFQIAKKLLGRRESYSLSVLVPDLLGFDYHAHLASDDAYACGRLFAFLLHGHLNEEDELEAYMERTGCAYPKTIYPPCEPSLF